MKLIRFLVLAVLILCLAVTPAWTQTPTQIPVAQLPFNLNTALCVNDWGRALSMLQELLSADNSGFDRQQLLVLRQQIARYEATGARVDQSESCAAAVAVGQGSNTVQQTAQAASLGAASDQNAGGSEGTSQSTCNPRYRSTSGKCLSNETAFRRHQRSWEEGDRPGVSF